MCFLFPVFCVLEGTGLIEPSSWQGNPSPLCRLLFLPSFLILSVLPHPVLPLLPLQHRAVERFKSQKLYMLLKESQTRSPLEQDRVLAFLPTVNWLVHYILFHHLQTLSWTGDVSAELLPWRPFFNFSRVRSGPSVSMNLRSCFRPSQASLNHSQSVCQVLTLSSPGVLPCKAFFTVGQSALYVVAGLTACVPTGGEINQPSSS